MKHHRGQYIVDAKMFRVVCFCSLLLATGLVHGEIKNKGWWKNAVFYQIYPRSFMDSNDDGVGDLKGITSKLEHFVDAGVQGIWLSPIYASPMIDFGYDISDFKAIHPEFGTMEDFEALVEKSKRLGLKVILDLVPNHTSDKHEWFQKYLAGEKKYKDYYIWRKGRKDDGVTPPNNWISVFSGPAWTYNATLKEWYFHQFEYRQPDLNYSNKEVQAEMEDVILFWLRKGIDGFRIDAVPHLFEREDFHDEPRSSDPNATDRDYTYLDHIYTKDDPRTYELVKSWRKILDDYSDANNEDEKVMMTEAYTSLENTTRYYQYGSHIPFNFKLITDVNHNSSASDFKRIIEAWIAKTPKNGSANWVLGNHDRSRTASRYPKRESQMIMLPMILPGVAVTYYGEEIGMIDKSDISWEDTQDPQACNAGKDKYRSRSRDPNRTPFQWDSSKNAGFSKGNRTWLPVHENYKLLNLQNQKNTTQQSLYKIYRSLIQLRNSSPALQEGELKMKVSRITSKLEHFVDAGVRGIWLSPIYASPMVDFGYDISDFKAIHPEFGTMEDFEALVEKSKRLGLKVILDLVPNHTSDKHEWFQKFLAGEKKYKDYYVWRKGRKDDGVTPPNNWISLFSGPAWTYNATLKEWYLHQFEYRQPDLNYSNPVVQAEMEDVILFWLRKGIDGFRIDAVPHLFEREDFHDEPRSSDPNATDRDYTYLDHIYTKDDPRTYELVKSWRKILDDYSDANNEDEKVMMTEAYTSLENTTRYYQYGSHIPFNFKLITDVNHNSSASDFKRIIEAWIAKTPKNGSANWVLGNHDRSRTASRYPKRVVQMTMLPMILPGVAVTYYGEEIGMSDKNDISWEDTQDPQACNAGKDKYQIRSRDPCRTPFQWDNSKNAGFSKSNRTWLPVHASYKLLNLESQKNIAGASVYKVYRSLIQLRNTSRALQNGDLKMNVYKFNTHYCYNCEMLVISREIPGEVVTFFMSFSPVLDIFVDLKEYMPLYNETYVEADGYYPERHKPYWNHLNLPPWEGAVVSSRN
ncbi:maltase 1-like [Vespa mandarinia]|nr:maltase 1-like [Vespa mandarinia]